MGLLGIFPFFIIFLYLTIFGFVLYMVYTWVNKFISLREEQNNLLREIIKKMDKNVN